MATSTLGDSFSDDAPKAYTYNADGSVATVTAAWAGNTYRKTYTYSAGVVTNDSGWVKL